MPIMFSCDRDTLEVVPASPRKQSCYWQFSIDSSEGRLRLKLAKGNGILCRRSETKQSIVAELCGVAKGLITRAKKRSAITVADAIT